MNKPKVSVCTVTYNHENYIGRAIESVIEQKGNFEVEMIVGEDCSTDNTRAILKKYADTYPDIVKPIYHARNVGPTENNRQCFAQCNGKYIAALEGDDFWTDSLKLHKQVRFLEENPDYNLCHHAVENVNANGRSLGRLDLGPQPDTATLTDYVTRRAAPATLSCVFRNCFSENGGLPAWFVHTKVGDLPLLYTAIGNGLIKYFPEVMGAYRHHAGGAWSSQSYLTQCLKIFDTVSVLLDHTDPQGELLTGLYGWQLNQLVAIGQQAHETAGFDLAAFVAGRQSAMQRLLGGLTAAQYQQLLGEVRLPPVPWPRRYTDALRGQARKVKHLLGLA